MKYNSHITHFNIITTELLKMSAPIIDKASNNEVINNCDSIESNLSIPKKYQKVVKSQRFKANFPSFNTSSILINLNFI